MLDLNYVNSSMLFTQKGNNLSCEEFNVMD